LAGTGERGRIGVGRAAALLALGGVYSLNSGLYFLALRRIPATATSLIFYSYPAMVTVLGLAFRRHRASGLKFLALALALVGVALTVGFARGPLDPTGAGLALGAAVIVAVYLVLSEIALAGALALQATSLVLTGAALAFFFWEIATGGIALPPTLRGWLIVGLLATVSTGLSMLAMLASIRRVGAGTTSIVQTVEPAVTAALAAALLAERLTLRQYAGGALIVTGVLLLRLESRPAGATGRHQGDRRAA